MNKPNNCLVIQGIARKFNELQKNRELGKTAMMKYLYLLQQVYKLPLNYSYEIYTYGPYTSEVMSDIETAESLRLISVSSHNMGYNIQPSDDNSSDMLDETYKEKINDVISIFGGYNAKELELFTTIIYLYNNYIKNGWEASHETISKNVKDIKPYFDLSVIKDAYSKLNGINILKMAV